MILPGSLRLDLVGGVVAPNSACLEHTFGEGNVSSKPYGRLPSLHHLMKKPRCRLSRRYWGHSNIGALFPCEKRFSDDVRPFRGLAGATGPPQS